eukprot:10444795-Ditylum_brightwellii.AAC.1
MHTLTCLGIKGAKVPRGKALKGMKTCSQMSFYEMTDFVHHYHYLRTEGSRFFGSRKTFDGWNVDIFGLINKERLYNVPVLCDKDKVGIMNVAPGYATLGKAKMLSLEDFVQLKK